MTAKLPTMIPVESSNIVAVGYDPHDRYLFIRFKSGIYRFEDVSPALHEQLLAADSKGKFVGAEIKGKYQSSKVPQEQPAGEKAE